MASRLQLHNEFIDVLGTQNETESRVYYDPPQSLIMKYPCIRYKKSAPSLKRANNGIYNLTNVYEATVIDPDPDSVIAETILYRMKQCSIEATYTADNLHHTKLKIYY